MTLKTYHVRLIIGACIFAMASGFLIHHQWKRSAAQPMKLQCASADTLTAALAGLVEISRPVNAPLTEHDGYTLVAFFCGCPPCHKLASEWGKHLHDPSLQIIAISSLGPGDIKDFEHDTRLSATYMMDADDRVRNRLDIASCPHYILFSRNGCPIFSRDATAIRAGSNNESAYIKQLLSHQGVKP